MDDSPCPYIYDDGTSLFLDEGFELHCQKHESEMIYTNDIFNLRNFFSCDFRWGAA